MNIKLFSHELFQNFVSKDFKLFLMCLVFVTVSRLYIGRFLSIVTQKKHLTLLSRPERVSKNWVLCSIYIVLKGIVTKFFRIWDSRGNGSGDSTAPLYGIKLGAVFITSFSRHNRSEMICHRTQWEEVRMFWTLCVLFWFAWRTF